MNKVVDMWGHEIRKGDYIHGIDLSTENEIGWPSVCGYKVTKVNKDGSITAEDYATKCKKKFVEPDRYVSRSDLRYYSLDELGYEKLCFASSAYFLND